jgi:serine/threonine-protein kinase
MSTATPASVEAQARGRVGRVLCNRYRLVRLIGVGGMGAVYAAVHNRNGHRVAVKVLHPALCADRESRRRFRREALVANHIGHPGALAVLDDDVAEDGSAFLVLPLLRGETLRARWERSGRKLPFPEVVAVVHGVLGVLAAAHAANVVHRDIKPENVFLTRSGEIRVLDFGIAHLLQTSDSPFAGHSATGTAPGLLGTPAFMAPEQVLGRAREVDARTDLWAVGAMMFSLLSGRFVHEGETPGELLVNAATRPVTSVHAACADTPAPIRAVIERALAFDKAERWPDAASMDAALADAFREVSGADIATIPPLTTPDADNVAADDDGGSAPPPVEGGPPPADESAASPRLSPPALSRTTRPATDVVTPQPPRRSPWLARAVGLVLLVTAGAFALGPIRAALRRKAVASEPRQADGGDLLSRCAPSARPMLTAGLQLLREASEWDAAERFDEASRADPQCAVASLYYVFSQWKTLPRRRELFQFAREHRSLLTDRETDLLDAMEPSIEDPPNVLQMYIRSAALLSERPTDPDVVGLRLQTLLILGRGEEVVKMLEAPEVRSALTVPQIEAAAGVAEGLRGNPDRAVEHFDRCRQVAPASSDCTYMEGILQGQTGQCSAAEATFRHFTTVAPENSEGWWLLGHVLLSSNLQAARFAFEQRWARLSPVTITEEAPEAAQISDEFRLAFATGDLEKSLDVARTWKARVTSSTSARYHLEPLIYQIEILRELGRTEEARRLAMNGLMEQRAWTPDTNPILDAFISLARLAYLTGGIDAAQFRQYREEWAPQRTRREIDVWLNGYAGLPEVGSDVPIPVEEGAFATDGLTMSMETWARTADELSRAGRHADAIRHAEAATRYCLFNYPVMGKLHARVTLASVYDAAGDKRAACNAYASLVSFLGRTPSVSVAHAKKRLVELSCARR